MESATLIYSVRHQAFGRELSKLVKAMGWDVSPEQGTAVIVIADAHSWAAEGIRNAYEEWGWRLDANRLLVLWVSAWAPVPLMLPPGAWMRGWAGGKLSPSEVEAVRQFLEQCSSTPSRKAVTPSAPAPLPAAPPVEPVMEPAEEEAKAITAAVKLPPVEEIAPAVMDLPAAAEPACEPEPEIFASQSLESMEPEASAPLAAAPVLVEVPAPPLAPRESPPIPPVILPVPSMPRPAPVMPPMPAPARAAGTGTPDREIAVPPPSPSPVWKKAVPPGPAAPVAAVPSRREARTSVFCPEKLEKGRWFTLQVWLHGPEQGGEVTRMAVESGHGGLAGRKTGLSIASGALVGFSLVPKFLQTKRSLFGSREPQHRYAQWNESATNVDFAVCCPKGFREPVLHETIEIAVEGIPVGSCTVELAFDRSGEMKTEFAAIRTAFASYSSEDREQVIGRLQMLAATVGVEPFFDVDSLRMGEDWQQRLLREVPTKDRFLLFWSENARKSEWVEREWRLALRERGLDYILPVPLQPSTPPKELSKLQFNDRFARMVDYERLRRRDRP